MYVFPRKLCCNRVLEHVIRRFADFIKVQNKCVFYTVSMQLSVWAMEKRRGYNIEVVMIKETWRENIKVSDWLVSKRETLQVQRCTGVCIFEKGGDSVESVTVQWMWTHSSPVNENGYKCFKWLSYSVSLGLPIQPRQDARAAMSQHMENRRSDGVEELLIGVKMKIRGRSCRVTVEAVFLYIETLSLVTPVTTYIWHHAAGHKNTNVIVQTWAFFTNLV